MKSTNLWLGSQTSYEAVLEARENALAKLGSSENMPAMPMLLSVQGNVGIIDIQGSLVNGNAGYLSYFGITGYGDIRDALTAAVQNPEISAILLNIDSGGGAVAGVHETAQLISRVNKVKPVCSYTGGTEASAALWLGSSARTSFAAETALVGSLGILMVHAERSKQLENDGIKVTVIRAGDEKALANPYEPLSKEAKSALESKAQAIYDVFLGHVAEQRGVPNATADAKFGQGKEFIGKDAVTAGLIDSIGTLEDAYTKASKLGEKVAKKSPALNTGAPTIPNMMMKSQTETTLTANMSVVLGDTLVVAGSTGDNAPITEGTPMPKPLTQEQLIAMAAGVQLEEAPTETTTTASTDATTTTTEPATEITATLESKPSEVQVLLEAQLKTAQAELLTAKMEAKAATESLAAASPQLEALATIARSSIKTMTIALGGKAESIDAMSAADVASEHSRVAEVFKTKFKVGAVAATSTIEEPKPVTKAKVDPLFLSAVQSLSK